MKFARTIAFVTLAFWLVTSLLVSGNLVLCFSNSHTALEYAHGTENSLTQIEECSTSFDGKNDCIDIQLSKKVEIPTVFKAALVKIGLPYFPVIQPIQLRSKVNLADRFELPRAVDDFVSSVRFII